MPSSNFDLILKPTIDYIDAKFRDKDIAIDVHGKNLFPLCVTSKTVNRTLDILNKIIIAIRLAGYSFQSSDKAMELISVSGRRYTISIQDRRRKMWRAATAAALEKSKDYIERAGRIRVKGSSKGGKYDEYYSGKLCLKFGQQGCAPQKSWSDLAQRKLEKRLDEIVSEINAIIKKDEADEIHRQQSYAKEFHALKAYLARQVDDQREQQREQFLADLLRDLDELRNLKSWHKKISTIKGDQGLNYLARFINWTDAKILENERALAPLSLDIRLASLNIMNATDPGEISDESVYEMVRDYVDYEGGILGELRWPSEIIDTVERLNDLMLMEDFDKHVAGRLG